MSKVVALGIEMDANYFEIATNRINGKTE